MTRPSFHECALEGCEVEFEKTTHNKRYCSVAHWRADHRIRNREKINEQARKHYQKTGYANHLSRSYGITHDQFLELSKNGCEICGATDIRLVVDHDHTTGKVRGVLCVAHNAGLGSFHDSPEELRAAVRYLEKTRD